MASIKKEEEESRSFYSIDGFLPLAGSVPSIPGDMLANIKGGCTPDTVKADDSYVGKSISKITGDRNYRFYRRTELIKPGQICPTYMSSMIKLDGRKTGRPRPTACSENASALPDNVDPKTTVSIYRFTYPDSVRADWQGYAGFGWLHVSERMYFTNDFFFCQIDGTLASRSFGVIAYTGAMINNRHIKLGEWFVCDYDGKAYPKSRLVVVKGLEGDVNMSDACATERSFICDYDKARWERSCRVHISSSSKYKVVSRKYVSGEGDPFILCPECSKAFETSANAVLPRDDMGVVACTGCYETFMARDVIKAHNFTGYPKPIFHAIRQPLITEEAAAKAEEFMSNMGHPMAAEGYLRSLKKSRYLYGIECETEFTGREDGLRAKLALQAWKALGQDFCIIKHDGSLSGKRDPEPGEKVRRGGDFGFEIVSAPCDIETHRERWRRLESMPDYKQLRAWDVGTCGLHIHVSRAPMTSLQICRLSYMINHPKLKGFIEMVAGRAAARYNKFVPKRLPDGTKPNIDKDKYTAINLKHSASIEFRIFRGTVNWRHIIRNLEFVAACVAYCHPADRSLKDLESHEKFVTFISEHRKEWPELNRWLDLQEEFKRMIKPANKGAFGPKDNRTKAGEKPIVLEEVHDPDRVPAKPKPKPAKLEPATLAPSGFDFEELIDDNA